MFFWLPHPQPSAFQVALELRLALRRHMASYQAAVCLDAAPLFPGLQINLQEIWSD